MRTLWLAGEYYKNIMLKMMFGDAFWFNYYATEMMSSTNLLHDMLSTIFSVYNPEGYKILVEITSIFFNFSMNFYKGNCELIDQF